MDSTREKEKRKTQVITLTKTLKRVPRIINVKRAITRKIDLKSSDDDKPSPPTLSTEPTATEPSVGMPPKTIPKRVNLKVVEKGAVAAPIAAAAAAAASSPVPTSAPSRSPSLPTPPYNEAFIKVLTRLNEMLSAQGEPFRARAYKRAQETILSITHDITSVDELKKLPGIGETIIEKLNEYVATGTLALFEREKENPIYILTQVYGIGPKKADELVKKHGIRTIAALREQQTLLNEKQKIGLKYYEDILKRIPRSEIDRYQEQLKTVFDRVSHAGSSRFEIVGSYRRGARDSGDIDVIVTDDSGDVSVFKRFLDELRTAGIIIETLSEGASKSLAISRIDEEPARRIDFLFAPPEEYAFAVLYFTGSASFNVVMRKHALARGFTLSEHGIYRIDASGKKESRVDVLMPDERAIFDFLGLVYKTPAQRVDGRAVVRKAAASGAGGDEDGDSDIEMETDAVAISEAKADMEVAIATALVGDAMADSVAKETNLVIALPSPLTEPTTKKIIKRPPGGVTLKRKGVVSEPSAAVAEADTLSTESSSVGLTEGVGAAAAASALVPTARTHTLKIKSKVKAKATEVSSVSADLEKFKERGVDHLDSLSTADIAKMIIEANEAYYNKVPLLTDAQYDIVKEYLERRDPSNPALKIVGAPIKKDKVKLPFFMGSMDKIKPDTGALLEWKERFRGPYVLSAKLDGISGLYIVDPDGTAHLYTRGDGSIGQDITHVIPYLNLPRTPGLVIRGELIMTKLMFNTIYSKEGAANPRNLVAGILNRRTQTPADYRHIDFVAYEVIVPEGLRASEQMALLAKETIDKVTYRIVSPTELTNELLSEMLIEMREGYDYEIDGIIVTDDAVYPRKDGNPEHAFAFKMLLTDQVVEAKVVDVLWAASKDGYLKPRVRIEPVVIGGATIEYATAFNAAFVEDNRIGIGAVVRLVRSGDVIPHILSVETPAPTAKMPDVAYRWNDTHVDIMLEDSSSDADVRLKIISSFLKTLEVDGAGEGNVARMMKAGYDTIPKILAMSVSDYMKVEGFGEKLATKINTGIQKAIERADISTLMDATNIFGRGMGERRIREVMKALPDILTSGESSAVKVGRIMSIKGFASKTAEQFVANIPAFLAFLEETGLQGKLSLSEAKKVAAAEAAAVAAMDTSHPLYGKSVVMSGFRDKELAAAVEARGGKISESVSKNTGYVVVKDLGEDSGKAKKARELGIPLMVVDEFKKLL